LLRPGNLNSFMVSEISSCVFVVIINSIHNLLYELKRPASLNLSFFFLFFFLFFADILHIHEYIFGFLSPETQTRNQLWYSVIASFM